MEGVNSNLSTHLGTKNHEAVKKDYEALMNKGKPSQSILIDTFNSESFKQANSKTNSQSTNNLINMGAVKRSRSINWVSGRSIPTLIDHDYKVHAPDFYSKSSII